jgi:hypothetical protein
VANQALSQGGLPSNFKLVGVLIDKPSQVMIEDATTHNTYFISEGQTENGIGVVHADRDTVELNYGGKAISIKVKEINAGH